MKVLIVDDEPLVRLSLRRAFERRGHQVFEAVDGVEGLNEWRMHSPELVFLDVLMPRLTGPDLLRQLPAQNRQGVKVILISAFAGEYDGERAKALGADVFLAKPFGDIFQVATLGEELVNGQQ